VFVSLPLSVKKTETVSMGAGFDTVKSPKPPSHAKPAVIGAPFSFTEVSVRTT
jgi:hypothetical protein